jgi:lipopolysaccharide export system protein LptA
MISRLSAAAAALALFATAPALAATGVQLGGHDTNAPIAVSADNFTGDLETKVGTYSGNVIVSQGTFKLHADQVQIRTANGKADKIVASGHVLFDSTSGMASGETGVYELGPRTVTLTGNVVLTKDKNVMRGTQLTVNLDSGKAVLDAKGTATGRVQGLFTPPKKGGGGQQ